MKTEHLIRKVGKYALIGLAVGVVGTGIFTWLNDGQFGEVVMGEAGAAPFTEQRTLPGQNVKNITIKSGSTDIKMKQGTGDDVQVQLRGIGNVENLMQKYQFVVEQQGDTAHIEFIQENESLTRKFFRFQSSSSLTLEIQVPKKLYEELQVDIASGSVSIQDFQGKIVGLEAKSGRLELKNIEASRAELRVASGEVEVSSLKSDELIAEGQSGSFDMENISGALRLNLSSGSADLRFAELTKDVDIDVSSGEVTLYAPKSSSFEFDGRAASGDINVDFPNLNVQTQEDHELRGQVGSGGPTVRMGASSGDIEVKAY